MDAIVENLSDSKLIRVLQDYKKWVDTGEIESGSGLSRLRDIYRDYYMESGAALMERALLRECAYRWLEIKQNVCPRPFPCVRDEHGNIREQTVKALLGKIDEELNELKESIFLGAERHMSVSSAYCRKTMYAEEKEMIAEEAADTITAITTLLEALGIDAEMRDAAQRRVNAKNLERGRL